MPLLSCSSSPERQPDNISFNLPPALTKAAAEGELVARFVGSGAERKEVDLVIAADGKVSGTMTVKPGKWTFEVQFYQVAKSGDLLPVAFFHFDERDVSGEKLDLTYEAKDLKFNEIEPDGKVLSSVSPSIPPPDGTGGKKMCKKRYDCDEDGFSNWEEILAGSDPFDPKSVPVKPVTPAVIPPPPPPKPTVVSPPPPPPVVVNRPPVFGGYLSSVVALVKDPKAGITLSWNQSDPDGDEMTTTVSLYRGSLCSGGAVKTVTVKGSGKMETSLKDLEPRTDSSYNLLITDPKGAKALGGCRSFTTTDAGLVGWWRFDEAVDGTVKDSSGNEHHGALKRYSKAPELLKTDETSAALVTSGILPSWTKDGISGGALRFDGTGTVEVPDLTTSNLRFGNGNFSTEVWFRIPAGQTLVSGNCCETLIGKGRGGSGWMMELRGADYNGAWKFGEDNDDNPDNGSENMKRVVEIVDDRDGTKLNDGNWHQLVGVRDGLKGYAFLDGRLILSGTSAELADMEAFYPSKEIPLRIGFGSGIRALRGALDEVAVYNRALSAKEVRQSCSRISGTICNSLEPVPVNPIGNGTFAPDKDGKFPNIEWTTASEATHTWSLYKLPTATAVKTAGTAVKENQSAPTPSIDLNGILDYRTSYLLEVKACDLKDPSLCITRSWNFTTTQFGLVGWWRFDEGATEGRTGCATGETKTVDSSENRINGTLKNTPCWASTGIKGSALHFDGASDGDYVDLTADSRFDFKSGDFTIEGWIKTDGTVDSISGPAFIIAKHISGTPSGYFLNVGEGGPGRVDFYTADGSFTPPSAIPLISAKSVDDKNWHHIVGVYQSSGKMTLYIDGIKDRFNTASGIATNTTSLRIGAVSSTVGLFKGTIDEVAVYNRALSTTEIRASCRRNDPSTGSGMSPTCAADDVPDQVTPMSNITLPPTRGFISWSDVKKDSTKKFDHYQLCYSTKGIDISGKDDCLSSTSRTVPYFVLETLDKSSTGYRWKVRTCYTDLSCSAYSPVWSFSTDSSLVGWWKFNEATGVTAADFSGNGRNGTLSCTGLGCLVPIWKVGEGIGGSLLFDGVDDYVDLTSYVGTLGLGFSKIDNYTMEVRFRTNVSSDSILIQLSAGAGGVPDSAFVYSPDGNINYHVTDVRGDRGHPDSYQKKDYGPSFLDINTTSGGFSDNIFHHAVGVYRGDSNIDDDCGITDSITGITDCKTDPTPPQISLFVDGNLKGTKSGTIYPFVANDFKLAAFGKASNASLRYFKGLIDEVAIYKTNLSAEKVKNNFCALEALAGSDLKAKGCL